jgi:predicted 3-demethylubiquinone-9 3-methyltransferase (glyoxalase superfamily)/uncharacterized protein YndB with AHSA1/START domain
MSSELGSQTFRRFLRAPIQIVFACLTEPQHLSHHWGPAGVATPLEGITVEPRIGGKFNTAMINESTAEQYPMLGTFTEFEPPSLIEWTIDAHGLKFCSRITLTDTGNNTTMLVTHQTDVPEDMRTDQMREAMHSSYDKLDAYLATLIPSPPRQQSTGQIATCLWFDGNAVEAVEFYRTVFAGTQRLRSANFPPDTNGEAGTPMTVEFTLDGHDFVALNGGPHYKLTPAISFMVYCDTQAEVDYYWDKLVDGGTPSQCGWLTDRFGVSWQIIPKAFIDLMTSPDRDATNRMVQAMMQQIKLDLPTLRAAYDG